MENDEVTNPYMAGWGLWPPHFAGRQNELRAIVNALAKIKGKAGQMDHSPAPALVLVGPRGVGKTVLLGRAIEEAGKRGIHTQEITNTLLSGPQEDLVSRVFPDGVLGKVPEGIDAVEEQLGKLGVYVNRKDADKDFSAAVPAFLTKEPLLLVLDEAHTCKPEVLDMLFKIAHDCMSAHMPLALVLAGTPGLEPLMERCDATYVERSEYLRINTLSDAEAKDALSFPAREAGRPMKPAALNLLHGWADNNPYFIQLVGMFAWDVSDQRGGKEITVADAKAGLVQADSDRVAFYGKRHKELKKRHLAGHATQVVEIMRELDNKADVDELERRLMEVNEGMDNDRAMDVTDALQELGFLWLSDDFIEPGIPSMFDYVLGKAKVQATR